MAGSMPLTFVTKISILDFVEVLDMSLIKFYASINIDSVKFYVTAAMTGNGTFYQKSITQCRKTFITQPKHIVLC